jgi:16S rRNA processing protein RimM
VDDWITVALIVRARGNRGEVAAIGLSDRPERFEKLERAFLFGEKGVLPDQPTEVEEIWEHRGQVIFKFRGIDSISAAETLRGVEVRIPMAERAPLEEGEYYHSDLVGCVVTDKASGESIGTVAQVLEVGAAPLLEVKGQDGGEILVPLAKSICVEIDVKGRRIVAELPEGLKELNRS